jgi:nucleotide-binding universal stress UspA family protein
MAADVAEASPILVGVEFSASSLAALAWAVDAAVAFGAPLLVLHVVHDPAEAPGYYLREQAGEVEEHERVAGDMMREFMQEARGRLPLLDEVCRVDETTVVGLPVPRILEVAEREGARLIVMGAQGRTALADALLGSKVERVTHLARIPVTVVKTPAPAEISEEQAEEGSGA